jgi:Uma2 family endonuclease
MSTDSLVYETFEQATPHTTFGPYTAEDYLQLPEGERVELLRGRLIMMSPSPTPRHQFVGFRIAMLLEVCADSVGGLVLTPPMDVIFNDRTIAQPDAIYLRPDRLHQMRDRVYGAPSLLVEVLSPSTAARDRVEKRDLYGAAGVPEYWIVDTKTRIIEFHILDGTSYRVTAGESGLYQSPVFSEIQLDLTALWQYVDRKTPKP